MNILIVEDNRHMRRMLSEMLRSAFKGHWVLEAPDGNSALMMCRDACPQLVVVDVGLPDANGIELSSTIKALWPSTKVVVLSSHYSGDYLEAARQAGAAAYIVKEEIYDKLVPTLSAIMEEQPN